MCPVCPECHVTMVPAPPRRPHIGFREPAAWRQSLVGAALLLIAAFMIWGCAPTSWRDDPELAFLEESAQDLNAMVYAVTLDYRSRNRAFHDRVRRSLERSER